MLKDGDFSHFPSIQFPWVYFLICKWILMIFLGGGGGHVMIEWNGPTHKNSNTYIYVILLTVNKESWMKGFG